jgi:hypothetical protein
LFHENGAGAPELPYANIVVPSIFLLLGCDPFEAADDVVD